MTAFPGGRQLPPAVALLGFELSWADADTGEVEVFFTPRADFANLMGNVQGGFVAGMLDATASSALLARLDATQVAPTIEMKINFVRPTPIARLTARGRIVHQGGSIAFLEATLHDAEGQLTATATATARIVTLST